MGVEGRQMLLSKSAEYQIEFPKPAPLGAKQGFLPSDLDIVQFGHAAL